MVAELLELALPKRGASVMMPKANPAMRANGRGDLLCGACVDVLLAGYTLQSAAEQFSSPTGVMLIRCAACGATNELPVGTRP